MKNSSLIKAIVYLVLGILLCCSVINPDSLLNWMIAIALLIAGTILIVFTIYASRRLLTTNGILGSLLIALGILMIPALPGSFGISWMNGIAMIMMLIGACLLLDPILNLLFAKKGNLTSNIIVFILGAISFTLGICLWLIPEFKQFAGLMLGIFFIIYSVLLFISCFSKKDIIVVEIDK